MFFTLQMFIYESLPSPEYAYLSSPNRNVPGQIVATALTFFQQWVSRPNRLLLDIDVFALNYQPGRNMIVGTFLTC